MNVENTLNDLFSGLDVSSIPKEEVDVLIEASEDFKAVLEGKKPVHAKLDLDVPLPSDGGTVFYLGNKYNLTIVKSLSSFGSVHGYVYGPAIFFDKAFATGNSSAMSSTKFYSTESLKQLLKVKR